MKCFGIMVLVTSLTLTPMAGWADHRSLPETETPQSERTGASTQVTRPRPLPITGTPAGNRTGGGTRPAESLGCKETVHPPTALVPEDGKGATAVEVPELWFYMPYTNQDVSTVEFSVHDRNETTTLYRTSIQLADTAGVISIALPVALAIDDVYHWRLVINCEPDPSGHRDFVLDGWIVRSTPNAALEWDGVWYDALTEVATRYRTDPQNTIVRSEWIQFLELVGLSELGSAPFVNFTLIPN